jgi:hypothetical protein
MISRHVTVGCGVGRVMYLSSWLIYDGVGEGYVWYGMTVSVYAGLVDVLIFWG